MLQAAQLTYSKLSNTSLLIMGWQIYKMLQHPQQFDSRQLLVWGLQVGNTVLCSSMGTKLVECQTFQCPEL